MEFKEKKLGGNNANNTHTMSIIISFIFAVFGLFLFTIQQYF